MPFLELGLIFVSTVKPNSRKDTILLMSKDDMDGAIPDFTKAIELDSKSALFYANRGMALLLKGKEAEAQRDFDHCLELSPSFKPGLERQIKAIKEQRAKLIR